MDNHHDGDLPGNACANRPGVHEAPGDETRIALERYPHHDRVEQVNPHHSPQPGKLDRNTDQPASLGPRRSQVVGTSNTSAGAVAVKNYGSSRDSPTQELADQLDVTLGMLAVTERELARALNVTRHARHLPAARAWHAGP